MEEFIKEKIAKFQKILQSGRDSPVAFQALWNRDTNGWGLCLEVVYKYPTYHAHLLEFFRFDANFEWFTHTVPPWPEARVAQAIGKQLAQYYQVEFFFPSPNKPDDNCPKWWEKDKN